MKGVRQKKQLKKEAVMAALVLLGASCIVAGVTVFQSATVEDLKKTQTEVGGLDRKEQSLTNQLAKAKNSLRLYETIIQHNSQEDFSLNRELATATLNELNERYRLSNLSVSISPIKELQNESLQNASSVVIYSEVALKFKGISDEMIMGFTNDVARQFLGYVNITEFSMEKESDINGEALYAVSKGKKPGIVSGELKFVWLGLKLNAPADKPPAQAGS